MKLADRTFKYACIFALLFISSPMSAQSGKGDHTVSNVFGKALRVANIVINEMGEEMKEFKKDIEECCPEFHEVKDSLIVQTKRGLEQCRREFHRGFRQGLRGESYDPTKD
jgi:hypothetical protein